MTCVTCSVSNGRVGGEGSVRGLASINDGTDLTFDGIADLIEEHL
jgi:hypothetical protein